MYDLALDPRVREDDIRAHHVAQDEGEVEEFVVCGHFHGKLKKIADSKEENNRKQDVPGVFRDQKKSERDENGMKS